MQEQEKSILVVTCFGHFISHFNMLVFPALVLPLAGRTGLSLAGVLELSFWMYLLFGITALPWGLLADRLGAKPLMMLFFLGAGLCGLSAAYYVDDPAAFSLSLAGIGLFSGIYHPAGLGLISKGVSRVSYGMGINGMFGNVGLATAPLLSGLINWLYGPEAVYTAVGLINLVGLILMTRMKLVPIPRDHSASVEPNGKRTWAPFVALLAAMMMGGIAYRGSSVILPAYFELRSPGIIESLTAVWPWDLSSNLVATVITCLVYAVGIFGQYMGGKAGERFPPRLVYLCCHIVAMPAVLLMTWASDLPLMFLGLVYLLFLLGMQPAENTLVTHLSPPAWRHSAFGLKFVLTFGVGALAVRGVGLIQETWGIQYVFIGLGAVSLGIISAICVLLKLTDPIRRENPAEAAQPATR